MVAQRTYVHRLIIGLLVWSVLSGSEVEQRVKEAHHL